MKASERFERIRELRRSRPRSRLLRATCVGLAIWTLYSWWSPEIAIADFASERRLANLSSFLREELMPHALRAGEFSWSGLLAWIGERWSEQGAQATWATLQISILAITLAAILASPIALACARNFATSHPFESLPGHPLGRACWSAIRRTARALAILMRAIPEYILAFLLLAVLGPRNPWPAILALAIHNGGILGRLGGEVVENLEAAPLRSLSAIGARRTTLVTVGVVPLSLGRLLLYFFYRFETCVREATVLGMLGVVSLGYWIQDARAKQYYDEMGFLVLCGAGLVMLADLTSALARRSLRSPG